MVKDRGSIKWVSLMLPEHVNMLREWHEETKHDWTEPLLDEQQFQEMNLLMEQAMMEQLSLVFTVVSLNKPKEIIGKIVTVKRTEKHIKIQDCDGHIHIIKSEHIIDISLNSK